MERDERCLSLVRGAHRYEFRWQTGKESEVMASFVDLARDPDHVFDWFDAAVLTLRVHQLRERLPQAAR